MRRKEKEKGEKTDKTEEGKNDRHKKNDRRMVNMEEEGRSSKVRRRD